MLTTGPNLVQKIQESLLKNRSAIIKAALGQGLAERMRDKVKKGIDDLVLEGDQSVENQVDIRYRLNDRESNVILTITLGSISGSYTANITGSRKVADHTRSYEDARPWEFPDGHWETLNYIPAEIAKDAGWKALGYE
jgi:hypothetical protein